MRYHVDSEALAAGALAAGRTTEIIRAEVAALNSQLMSMQGEWLGTASLAFADVLSGWTAAAAHVNAALDDIQTALRMSATTYAETEAAATSLFRR